MNKAREQPIIIVRKKGGHGHGHHGGAWKVAFADFMTAMMALFLVLWLITQSSDVKSAIAGYFQDPLGRANEFGSSIIPGTGAQSASPRPISQPQVVDMRRDRIRQLAEEIRERLKEAPDLGSITQHVEIEITNDGLRVQLIEDSLGIFFETGSATPKAQAADLLRLLGSELAKLPNYVIIEGYTDARPYTRKDGYSNWELSVDRANAARRILVTGGLNLAQIQQVRGWADRQLRNPDDPLAPSNRRVTVTMLLPKDTAGVGDSVPAPAAAGNDSAAKAPPAVSATTGVAGAGDSAHGIAQP